MVTEQGNKRKATFKKLLFMVDQNRDAHLLCHGIQHRADTKRAPPAQRSIQHRLHTLTGQAHSGLRCTGCSAGAGAGARELVVLLLIVLRLVVLLQQSPVSTQQPQRAHRRALKHPASPPPPALNSLRGHALQSGGHR